jgi:hypothetical protein
MPISSKAALGCTGKNARCPYRTANVAHRPAEPTALGSASVSVARVGLK